MVMTTLSGVTIKVSLSVAKFDPFEDLEDRLWTIWSETDLKVFGFFCKLPAVQSKRPHFQCILAISHVKHEFGRFRPHRDEMVGV